MITSDFDNNLLLCKGMIYKIGSFPGDVKKILQGRYGEESYVNITLDGCIYPG
jgi:hypothetical protein